MSQSSEELFGKARERLAGGVSHESRFKGPSRSISSAPKVRGSMRSTARRCRLRHGQCFTASGSRAPESRG